jgi:hypothetical protein
MLFSLPLVTPQTSASPLPVYLQMKDCAFAVAEADKVIDTIADVSRTEDAKKQLEIARNMMDQQDAQGCMTHADNAVRAVK